MGRKFYGKWIVIGCFLLAAFPVALVNKTVTFYMAPVCAEYGFSIAAFSLVYALAALGAAVGAVAIGSLISKGNIKFIMAGGALISGVSFFLVSLSTQLWHFYVLFPILDLGLAAISSVPLSYLVGNWYIDKRGTMTAIVFVGIGMGGVILSPTLEYIITNYSWQVAAQISAALILLVSIPISLLIIKKDPAAIGQQPYVELNKKKDSDKGVEELQDTGFKGVSKSVAIKSPTFYILAFSLICLGIAVGGIMVHIPNFMTTLGISYGIIMAVLSVAAMFGTLLSGVLFDKVGAIVGMLFTTILLLTGCVSLMLVSNTPALAYVMAIAVGFSVCIANTGPPLLTSAMYGMKDYSKLFGIQYAMFLIGCIIGPIVSGVMVTKLESYTLVWVFMAIVTVVMFVTVFAAIMGGKRLYKQEALKAS